MKRIRRKIARFIFICWIIKKKTLTLFFIQPTFSEHVSAPGTVIDARDVLSVSLDTQVDGGLLLYIT